MFRWLARGTFASDRGASGSSPCPSHLHNHRYQALSTRTERRVFSHNSVQYAVNRELDYEAARKWHSGAASNPVPNTLGEVSYARSSGPGGQNVNKVNSKAQLRVSLDQLLPLLPEVLHEGIRRSSYCAIKTNSLLVQSDESRRQAANRDTCYRKLNQLVLDVYDKTVPGETSPEQQEKVKGLQKRENEARLQMKKVKSSKKAARQKGRSHGDD